MKLEQRDKCFSELVDKHNLSKIIKVEKMIHMVESIAQKFNLVYCRIDILSDGKEMIKVNEIALYPASGFWGSIRILKSVDLKIGQMFKE